MAYLVLSRKYRPATLADVIGQEHITDLLAKAINNQKVAHAYLFCGPRGIGKTSCARILAKSLNCQDGPTLTPCLTCSSCKEIAQGNGFDVIEIDGASNRGIDEIRTLRENVKFAPSYGRYKIYIVDEVHMLTAEAFNALLKTLEEPPEHAKFIFATTEPHKLPPTIISRCQRFDFKRIALKTMVQSLKIICDKEQYIVTEDALYAIAKASQGSFRDALSVLDQVGVINERKISGEDIYSMLGLVETELLFQLVDALIARDCAKALEMLDVIMDRGKDIRQMARDLVEHFRNLMIMRVGGKALERLIDYSAAIKESYYTQSQKFSVAEILTAIDEFIRSQETARITETLRTPLEIAFARLILRWTPQASESPKSEPTSVKASGPVIKSAAVQILKDQRGSLAVSPSEPKSQALLVEDLPQTALKEIPENNLIVLTLDNIQKGWDALTYAVSREKMSVATFLQEGKPVALKGERLTIAFSKDHEFYKEALGQKESLHLVERVFSQKLNSSIVIEYKVMETPVQVSALNHEPVIKNTLDTFKGKIVSEWHNE